MVWNGCFGQTSMPKECFDISHAEVNLIGSWKVGLDSTFNKEGQLEKLTHFQVSKKDSSLFCRSLILYYPNGVKQKEINHEFRKRRRVNVYVTTYSKEGTLLTHLYYRSKRKPKQADFTTLSWNLSQ